MYTDHNAFILKRSRLAIAFSLLIFILITILSFETLPVLIFLLIFIIQIIIYYFFIKNIKLFSLHYLDHDEWTLSFNQQNKTERIHITRLINHHLYIVIYFDGSKRDSVVIWCDQLSANQWKNLVVLARFL